MCAPKGPGRRYVVHLKKVLCSCTLRSIQDTTGNAKDIAMDWCKGVGAKTRWSSWNNIQRRNWRRFVWEQAVLCGGLTALIEVWFWSLDWRPICSRISLLWSASRNEIDRWLDLRRWIKKIKCVNQFCHCWIRWLRIRSTCYHWTSERKHKAVLADIQNGKFITTSLTTTKLDVQTYCYREEAANLEIEKVGAELRKSNAIRWSKRRWRIQKSITNVIVSKPWLVFGFLCSEESSWGINPTALFSKNSTPLRSENSHKISKSRQSFSYHDG